MTFRPVTLCADDFALTEGVSLAILELAEAGRLSATGAMTNRPWWPRLAGALAALDRPIGRGLHLNLTSGASLTDAPRLAPGGAFQGFNALVLRGLGGRLPPDEVGAEIAAQLDAFERALGRPPDFVDGHQHVHVLPVIRGALLRALAARGLQGRVWLRDPSDAITAIMRRGIAAPKALTVRSLALGFRRAAEAAGFAMNDGFSGFSDFDEAAEAAPLFEAAFGALGPRPLVMCHPGRVDPELAGIDPVLGAREREWAYLASDAFPALLTARQLTLAPAPTQATAALGARSA